MKKITCIRTVLISTAELLCFTRSSTGLRSSSSTAWTYLQDYLQDSDHQAQLPEHIYKIIYWTQIIKLNCLNILTRSSNGLWSSSSTAWIYLQDQLLDSNNQVQLPEYIYKIIYRTQIMKLNCSNMYLQDHL